MIGLLAAKQKPKKTVSSAYLCHNLEKAFLEVTSNCNLRCLHCYGDFGYKKDELMIDDWKAIIDELDRLNVLEVHFTGGEPFLRKDIFELVDYVRKKPMAVTISTNGTLIDKHVADRIKESKISAVRVSLDGANPKTHDELRGVKGTFEKAINSIRLLVERKVCVRINCCITKHNFKETPQMLSLFEKLGVNEYVSSLLYFSGRDQSPPDLCFSPNDYEELEFVVKAVGLRSFMEDINMNEYKSNEEVVNCGVGTGSIVIKSDGKAIPCPYFDTEEFIVGDVKRSSIREIWENSELLNKLRAINARQISKCSGCKYLMFCRGGCRARAYRVMGDMYGPDPFACIGMISEESANKSPKDN